MRHFVAKRLHNFFGGTYGEVSRIHGDFVRPGSLGVNEPLRAEIAIGLFFSLEGDQAIGQDTIKQLVVKVIICPL